MHRPTPRHAPPRRPGQPPPPPPPPQFDPIAAVPAHLWFNTDVPINSFRTSLSQIVNLRRITNMIIDLATFVLHKTGIMRWNTMKQETCSLVANRWSINAVVSHQDNTVSHSALRPLKDGQPASISTVHKRKESSSITWLLLFSQWVHNLKSKVEDRSFSDRPE